VVSVAIAAARVHMAGWLVISVVTKDIARLLLLDRSGG
jgi:hypothetical protein